MHFKKLLSYFYPINIKTLPSKNSKSLEINLINGRYVMDSLHTNYSFGSLQKVLKKGLLAIDHSILSKSNNILLLGVAGGSVISTLRNDFRIKAKITGIEIDPIAIQLANEFFNLEQITNTTIIQDDAFSFLSKTPEMYDLIIVDLFNDKQMPEELFQDRFWKNLKKTLTNNGIILFNTMVSIDGVPDKNKTITPLLHSLFSTLKIVKSHNKHNAVFIIKN